MFLRRFKRKIFISFLSLIPSMQTGFDMMEYDTALRRLWGKRVAADLIDFSITFSISYFIAFLFHYTFMEVLFVIEGVVWFLYSLIFDAIGGRTPGKMIMGLRAVSFIGKLGVVKSIGRNLTKLNWIAFIADVIAGLSTEGEPRQRLTERFLDSLVVNERKVKKRSKKGGKGTKAKKVKRKKKVDEEEELELPT